ncbi:MAG: hypothetical protein AB1345_06700 [Chloroflexota bacterium]
MSTKDHFHPSSRAKYPPGEDELMALLRHIDVQPSKNYYQRMANAPWTQHARDLKYRKLALTIFVLLILAGIFMTITPLRTQAYSLLRYFLPNQSDTLSLNIPIPDAGLPYEIGSSEKYTLTQPEVEALSDFPIEWPARPENLLFQGAYVNPQLESLSLLFTFEGEQIVITQRSAIHDFQRVGSSASIEVFQIGNASVEYLQGGWRLTSTSIQTQSADQQKKVLTLKATWDPNLSQQILRWEDNDILFEIYTHSKTISKDTLIEIAKSLILY